MEFKLSDSELDLPPEYCHYRDEGYEIHKSCLDCPLPSCVYEVPGGKQRWLKRQRNRQMAKKFISEGKEVKELAQSFGISTRTVQRVLKSYLSTPLTSPPKKEDKNE